MAAVASCGPTKITVRVEHADGTWQQCVFTHVRAYSVSMTRPLAPDARRGSAELSVQAAGLMEVSEGQACTGKDGA